MIGASNCVSQATAAVPAAETAVWTSIAESVGVEPNNQGLRIRGVLTLTGNASASTVVIKVRQGSGVAGATVYTSPALTVGAAGVAALAFDCLDAAPVQGNNIYTVTATPSLAATLAVVTAGVEIADQYQGN
jgi:hypothetical protein